MIINVASTALAISCDTECRGALNGTLEEILSPWAHSGKPEPSYCLEVRFSDHQQSAVTYANNQCVFSDKSTTTDLHTNSSHAIIDWERRVLYLEQYRTLVDLLAKNILEHIKLLISILKMENESALPLHCSSVSRDDEAVIFTGPSGSGKSTIASLLTPEWTIADDEFNLVVKADHCYQALPIPHGGLLDRQRVVHRAPKRVQAAFTLEQHTCNQCITIPFREAYFELAKNVFMLPISRGIGDATLANLEAFCRATPIKKLRFAKSDAIRFALSNYLDGLGQ